MYGLCRAKLSGCISIDALLLLEAGVEKDAIKTKVVQSLELCPGCGYIMCGNCLLNHMMTCIGAILLQTLDRHG